MIASLMPPHYQAKKKRSGNESDNMDNIIWIRPETVDSNLAAQGEGFSEAAQQVLGYTLALLKPEKLIGVVFWFEKRKSNSKKGP